MFGNKINEKIGINAIMAMVLNGIVLLEGSFFWFVITRQLTTKHKSNFIGAFVMFKKLNIALIGVTLLTITINPFVGPLDKIGTSIFILLAILEHINYFETQLMYDNRNDLNI